MKFKAFIVILFHILLAVILTILTQIGGVIYIISVIIISSKKSKYKLKRLLLFSTLYFFSTFIIIPNIAPFFGRVKINDNNAIEAHNFITKLCNRNYVTSSMYLVLNDISLRMHKEYPTIKLIYLDANFPFFDGFPLLPHLSHNDGKKIDISFIYEGKEGKITNLKPSRSGYGIFIAPNSKEINQPEICSEKDFWQYSFTKHLTFGHKNRDLKLSKTATKKLIEFIIQNNNVSKIFIEPHLKQGLNLKNLKIRFHGCRAVRHDDHIHFQIH